jgi:hypothetical protein
MKLAFPSLHNTIATIQTRKGNNCRNIKSPGEAQKDKRLVEATANPLLHAAFGMKFPTNKETK